MLVIFTDLDGTLLDRSTYSWDAASPALDMLRERRIPWVFVSSKTRPEVEYWRSELNNTHPFSTENGAATFVPKGYFDSNPARAGHDIAKYGLPYREVTAALMRASRDSRCRIRPFHEMPAEEIARVCDLPVEQAVLAKQREFDEPFEIIDTERAPDLESAMAAQGLYHVRGGRFHHASGKHDKGCAVAALANMFRSVNSSVTTVGFGDGRNDISLFKAVDLPVVIPSPDTAAIVEQIPHTLVATQKGPQGWGAAVMEIVRSRDDCS